MHGSFTSGQENFKSGQAASRAASSCRTALQQEDKSCIEVLQQVAAIKGAVNGLMNELIESHLREHVIKQNDDNEKELAEFLKLLKRYT